MLNKISKKEVLIITIVISILLLIPIIWISFYNHPSADDFNYGVNTINVLNNKGIVGIIAGSLKTLNKYYYEWQGTYSAIILFSLNPSIWGHNFYFLSTIILVFSFLFSLYYLLKQIIIKVLKGDNIALWIITLLLGMLSIETIPSKTQGLFWWNGSVFYMFFFSLELIEIALLIKKYFTNDKKLLISILLYPLVFIIAGGNYITSLQQIIILFFLNIYLIFYKKDKSCIALLLVAIIGLLISALAPGNAVRAAQLDGNGPIKAIILSFFYAGLKSFEWLDTLNLFILFLAYLFLIPTYKNNNFKFKYSLFVIGLIYCIFSAEFTPTLYSEASIGPERLINIMYISYLLFFLTSLYYIGGSIRNRLIKEKIINDNTITKTTKLITKYSVQLLVITLVIFAGLFLAKRNNMTSYISFISLTNGSAAQYDKEYKERIKVLENPKIKEVSFEEFSTTPYPIFYVDIEYDRNSWRNTPIAKIYHKEYVKLGE